MISRYRMSLRSRTGSTRVDEQPTLVGWLWFFVFFFLCFCLYFSLSAGRYSRSGNTLRPPHHIS